MNSTHLIDFGPGRSASLAIVCGNYYRLFKTFVFGGAKRLVEWKRMPEDVTLIPCVSPIVESEGFGLLNTSDNLH